MAGEGEGLEVRRLRRLSDRAAPGYDEAAALQREVARRMGSRLDYIKIDPVSILDIGCGTGADLAWFAERYPKARRIGCDFSIAMLARVGGPATWLKRWLPGKAPPMRVCADARRLPIVTGAVDLVWSNLMLQWLADPAPALAEALRVLRTDGLLMFSTLGPDTLKELRAAFRAADEGPHVLPFIDMHDIGDILINCGFAEPVMDMEMLTLTFPDPQEMLRELRSAASGNIAAERRRSLTGKGRWRRMLAAIEAQRRDGRIAMSFEVVYGHAWKAAPRKSADGRSVVSLDALRRRP